MTRHYQHKPASTSSLLSNQTTRSIVLIRNGVSHHDGTQDKDEVLIRILEIIKANISGGKFYLFSSFWQSIALAFTYILTPLSCLLMPPTVIRLA